MKQSSTNLDARHRKNLKVLQLYMNRAIYRTDESENEPQHWDRGWKAGKEDVSGSESEWDMLIVRGIFFNTNIFLPLTVFNTNILYLHSYWTTFHKISICRKFLLV